MFNILNAYERINVEKPYITFLYLYQLQNKICLYKKKYMPETRGARYNNVISTLNTFGL